MSINFTKMKVLLIGLTSLFFTGCYNLDNIAQMSLYPTHVVNKTQTSLQPVANYKSLSLKVDSMKINVWYFENPQAQEIEPDADESVPTIIYFLGNGMNIGSLQKGFLEYVKSLRANIVTFEYPSYGNSIGTPSEQNLVASGIAVVRWVQDHFKNSSVFLWGQSLGAGVAIQVGAQMQKVLSGIILTSPWDKLESVMKLHYGFLVPKVSDQWKKKNQYLSIRAAEQVQIKTLIHHGSKDKLIPVDLGRNLAQHFPSTVLIWEELEGYEHNNMLSSEKLWSDIHNFLH